MWPSWCIAQFHCPPHEFVWWAMLTHCLPVFTRIMITASPFVVVIQDLKWYAYLLITLINLLPTKPLFCKNIYIVWKINVSILCFMRCAPDVQWVNLGPSVLFADVIVLPIVADSYWGGSHGRCYKKLDPKLCILIPCLPTFNRWQFVPVFYAMYQIHKSEQFLNDLNL